MTGGLMTAETPRCPKCGGILEDCSYSMVAPETFFRCSNSECGETFLKSNYGGNGGYFLIEQGK